MTVKKCLGKKPMASASSKVVAARNQGARYKKTRTRSGKVVKR